MSIKIKSAEIIGVQTVYSTNVEDNHNYVTDGNVINKNCVIDQDFQGEWHIDVHNTSSTNAAEIKAGDKLAQFIMYKVEYPAVELVDTAEELFAGTNSDRGEGAFGSTGV